MKKNSLRLFSLLLTLVMLLGSLPVLAEAGEVPDAEIPVVIQSSESEEKNNNNEAAEAIAEPEVTEQPEATDEPEVTEQPVATEEPEVIEQPEATDAPEVTEQPEATDALEVTEEPVTTEEPVATEEPAATEEPEVTMAPETTPEPEMLLEVPQVFLSERMASVDNSTTLPDNVYVPAEGNFSFSGGSGKTSFFCPKVTVSAGRATATLVVKSTSYTYFKVGDVEYGTSSYDGSSVYAEIPVALNADTTVRAYSSKMNTEIEYSIRIVLTEADAAQDNPAGDEAFVIIRQEASLKSGVITVTVSTSAASYDKLYLGSADDDQSSASYIHGTANGEGGGYTFVFELPSESLGQTVHFVPVKADGVWYSGEQCKLEIPADLVDADAPAEDEVLEDGDYDMTIESDYSMFKITSQSATVKGGVVTVTIGTSKNTYDRFHFGTYDDRDENGAYADFVQGVKKDGEDGYTFTFTLPRSYMGQKVAFVPGKPSGVWYDGKGYTNQYYMTIPKVSASDKKLEDGSYETNIESDYSMFKITSQSATVKGGVVTVTIGTSKNTYDRFHFGTYDDRDENGAYADFVQGVKKDGEDGYTFTFTLPRSYMGQKVAFVPGKPSGAWYEGKGFTQQYYMTIPSELGNVIAPDDEEEGDSGYADGEYTANAEAWVGFKLRETRIKINGDAMEVTLTTSQVSYDAMYLGSVEDADKSNIIQGKLVNGNSAMQFTFTLPVSALGTKVPFAIREVSGSWWKYQQSLTLPAAIDAAVPEQDVDVNSYADGKYTGETLTYIKTEINGEEAFNNNAAFSPSSTRIVVSGDKITVTFACNSTENVSFPYLYLGDRASAADAPASDLIECYTTPSSVAGGVIPHYTFELPRSALGQMITFSAYSRTGEKWYEYAMRISDKLTAVPAEPEPDQPGEDEGTIPEDGDYTANVESSASMFKVIACVLNVRDGKITASITLSGTGYDKLFVGTAEDAANASEGDWIGYTVDADGKYQFVVPVSALDKPIAIAAHSLKNDKWYDRDLTFKSEGLQKIEGSEAPDDGGNENPDEGNEDNEEITDPEQKPESDLSGSTSRVDSATALADGSYAPDKFSWAGGSGRVSISCNKVVVENGKAYAYLVFSSPDYSYVKANGQKIYGSHSGSTSTFKVPVELNANNRVLGMTTKMTADYEIAYTVYVYIAGAKDFGEVSAEAREAEIIGLNYDSAVEIENSTLFKAYRYEDGFIAIDVADVGRYLLAPEGVEVPVGLDEEATIIQLPVQSVYAADSFVLEMLEKMQNEEASGIITAVGVENSEIAFVADGLDCGSIAYAGDSSAPAYATLLKTSCDIAILPAAFAVEEDEEIDEATAAMIAEVTERLALLGIPAFVDRSAYEETEAGRLEWIKIYGMILGCEEEANALYEKLAAELPAEETAA